MTYRPPTSPTYVTGVAGPPSPTPYEARPWDSLFLVSTTNDAVEIHLPPGATHEAGTFYVIDIHGNAATNSITLIPDGGETINGEASFTIETDNAMVVFSWDSEWLFPTWEIPSYRMVPNSGPVDHVEGTVFYDVADKTLTVHLDAASQVKLQVGQELLIRARNNSGVDPIPNGTPVYISGAIGNRPTIAPATNNGAHSQSEVIGLTTHDIQNNSDGYVTVLGLVRDINTTGANLPIPEVWDEGDQLYLGVAGRLTKTQPDAPLNGVEVARVIRAHNNQGVLLSRPRSSIHLPDLLDVAFPIAVADGQVLRYSGANVRWENVPAGALGPTIVQATFPGPYNATRGDLVEADATGGPFTVQLPAAPSEGDRVTINKVDATGNIVTVSGNGTNINGAATFPLSFQYDSLTVVRGSAQWWIV